MNPIVFVYGYIFVIIALGIGCFRRNYVISHIFRTISFLFVWAHIWIIVRAIAAFFNSPHPAARPPDYYENASNYTNFFSLGPVLIFIFVFLVGLLIIWSDRNV